MKIRIQSSNVYVNNRTPRKAIRRARERSPLNRADSIGVQEGGKALFKGLRSVKGYRTFWKKSPKVHARHNPILLKRRPWIKPLGQQWFLVANGAGTKVTPPRNAFVLFYRKGPVKVAHINTHFHVVPEERLARTNNYGAAATQYIEHVKFVWDLMNQYKREGYVVFVTADGNTRPKKGHPEWEYSAYKYLSRGKWNIYRNGLDFIIHDSELVTRVAAKTIGRNLLPGADHDTLIGEYFVEQQVDKVEPEPVVVVEEKQC